MSFVLEQLRADQEEIEYLERAIVKTLFFKSQNPRNVILADFMIKNFLEEIQVRSVRALKIYQDEDMLKKEEILMLEGTRDDQLSTGNKSLDVWINFYEKINQTKEYHEKFTPYGAPAEIYDENWFFLHCLDDKSKIPRFTGQEGYGHYVDLHTNYLEFLNLKKIASNKQRIIKKLDYVGYLASFDQFYDIPVSCKDKNYESYLKTLLNYLKSFFSRTQPLFDINQLEETNNKSFEDWWNNKSIKGWEFIPNNLKTYSLYCLPCKKLFTNKNTYKAHKKGSKHIKNTGRVLEVLEDDDDLTEINRFKEIARIECFISRLRECIGDVVEDSMNNIRKKQTRTAEELEMYESDQEEPFKLPMEELKKKAEMKKKDQSSSSDDERPAYNPLNLPIGFDGKPIPYWLYKLHGLNVEYKCEICGNYSYWGRRAFERHFQEWRHAHGMRCLRIPNTMHFREITRIEEAIQLHKKLLQDHQMDMFRPDEEEECEDSLGNVMTKKKFVDLKRQGLL
jgi:splicing factor 3A subunit 3